MEASFRTAVHQLAIVGGQMQEHPPSITVVEGAALSILRRNRGSLYLFVELLGGLPDPAFTMGRLSQIVQDEYYQASGSVTGGMGQALRAANDWLFEENLNSPREQRGVAGLSCAVLRDGDLYLGQMGPAVAYLAQEDGLRRFPEDSPWLRQAVPADAERAAVPPLGVRRVIEPQFYHATPNVGDVLVVGSSALARLAPSQTLAEVIGRGGEAARRGLQAVAAGQDVGAIIVTLGAGPAPEEGEDEGEPVLLPQGRLGAKPTAPQPRLRPELQPTVNRAAQGLLTLLRRTLPDRNAAKRPRPVQRPAPTAKARPRVTTLRTVTVLAIALPVLAVALVLGVRYQYERGQRQQVADLLAQAGAAHSAAAGNPQKDAQRARLRQALDLIDRALVMAPDEPSALKLRQQVVDELDKAANVRRLYTLWPLADLPAGAAGPAQASRLLVRGSDLYIVDRGADRAYHRQLNPTGDALVPTTPTQSQVLVEKGEQRLSVAVGELLDMVWMPAGGERKAAGLLFLERGGSLLEWDATRGISVLPVADSAAWKKPVAAGAYSGNLYVLDAQQNRILKYVATAGGYTNPPTDYLASSAPDLAGAVDMGIDGHIYVLMADGKIYRFLSGKQQTFDVTGLDEPLRNPVAIAVTGEDEDHGALYVADAGLARVVQLDKKGQFVRQFRAAEGQGQLTGLSGLFVDEAQQRIYLGSGPSVYAAPLNQGN